MTREEINSMAKEAGWTKAGRDMEYPVLTDRLERFIALVAAAERQRMTDLHKAAEDALALLERWAVLIDGEWGDCMDLDELEKHGRLPDEITKLRAAIRARGESK